MKKLELCYKSGIVPYLVFNEDEEGVDTKGFEHTSQYRKIVFETHQKGILAYVLEAFAAHVRHLEKGIDVNPQKKFKIAVSSEGIRALVYKDAPYLCLPDSCAEEVEHLSRSSADDIASLNWFAYSAARESVLEWVEREAKDGYKMVRVGQARAAIADHEWRNIKKILSYVHLFNYPRPSNDRMGYLSKCGVTEVPLVLA